MLKQPVGFVKLTNVAVIKYKIKGYKFEIACYKNKAINWRNGIEKDLAEVLQYEEIYTNVIQGLIASKQLLSKVFPKMEKSDIIITILTNGDLQLGSKEREVLTENLKKSIVNIIQRKIVHPDHLRFFNEKSIIKAVDESNFNFKLDDSEKKQAINFIKNLEKSYYLIRTPMLFIIEFIDDYSNYNEVKTVVNDLKIEITNEIENKELKLVSPSNIYKNLTEKLKIHTNLKFSVLDKEYISQKKALESVNLVSLKVLKKQKEEILKIEAPKAETITNYDYKSNTSKILKCNTCPNTKFEDNKEFRDHIKTKWHKFNINCKLKNQKILGIDEFILLNI